MNSIRKKYIGCFLIENILYNDYLLIFHGMRFAAGIDLDFGLGKSNVAVQAATSLC